MAVCSKGFSWMHALQSRVPGFSRAQNCWFRSVIWIRWRIIFLRSSMLYQLYDRIDQQFRQCRVSGGQEQSVICSQVYINWCYGGSKWRINWIKLALFSLLQASFIDSSWAGTNPVAVKGPPERNWLPQRERRSGQEEKRIFAAKGPLLKAIWSDLWALGAAKKSICRDGSCGIPWILRVPLLPHQTGPTYLERLRASKRK